MEFQNLEELRNEASKYENVKSKDLVQIFKDNHIYFPDFVNRFLLINVCKKYFFDSLYMANYTDEFSYKLRSYQFFSIHLIRKTIEENNIIVDAKEYKNLFMRFFLKNQQKFKSSIALDGALTKVNENVDEAEETFASCLANFDTLFYTPKGYLDGLSLSIIKESIIETYNVVYLKDLGLKYGVDIPKRINKQQLLDLISARFMLTEEERAEISNKAIIDLIQYSKRKGFKVSSELKKSDMVEYLIYKLDKYNEDIEKDLYNYDIILDDEKNIDVFEQAEIEHSDQGIPTSSEFVDASEPQIEEVPQEEPEEEVVEANPEEEVVEEEEPKETEEAPLDTPTEETEEEPQEETPIEEPEEETKEEEAPTQETEEPKEENEDLIASDLYYDQTVDEEIRDIIKKYYSRKLNRDTLFKWILVIVIVVLCIALAYFAIMYYSK